MTRDAFNKLVANPLGVDESFGSELTALSEAYPWCQPAHLLMSVLDHQQQSPSFNDRLKRTAIHTADREVLFNLMMRPTLAATVEAFDERVEETSEDETEHQVEHEEVLEGEVAAEVDDALGAVDALEFDVPVIEDTDLEDDAVIEEEASELPEKRTRASDFDELQREIVIEAISSTIKREVDEIDDEASEETDLADPEEELDETADEIAPVAPVSSEPFQTVDRDPLTDAEYAPQSAYARWLLAHSKPSKPSASQREASTSELAVPDDSEPIDPKMKQLSIIDRFIQTDPKITPGKAELFSTENLAKMSLVEDEAFVTETMAMIYARQGNLKKAMKAYKLLSLKYPEKSIYFANQIKKLRDDGHRPKKQ